ncbi:[acyl-carrier-protein] S-malonyltransferase [Rhizomicrobium palustre]|uniref:Malonyl CoA-acyl carrier protein transacylase n=1 Tax=Rhizomicrobium palustre TaxID=189966 RepID=A0A846MUY2_9PROT|nr:ACP S-malonyltransferase [Rhizomicrobium palustre]NIK87035.1 [acyl-carrier-protein] S-malonyltransferase [Rhizomicrobium palustre]
MTRAFIFPGQGSQAVGMGKALAEAFAPAREVFQEVDEALSQHLSKLMWEGPESDLVLTENAQPAIMAASIAVLRVLEKEGGLDVAKHARLVAGHSLGEYSALCAAGAFTLADTAKLLKIRGRAMQAAVPVGEGGMYALIGADIALAEEVAKEAVAAATESDPVCVVANDNAPGQVVISGRKATVDRAGELAKAKGVKRALALAVSAPFHCPMMQPAAEAMAEALAAVTIAPLKAPVVANVIAAETNEPEAVRRLLVEQVTGRVRWRESIAALRSFGVETTVEFGGNKVLTGMVKRIDKDLLTVSLDTPADIEAFARTL